MSTRLIRLPTGAELRVRGEQGREAVLFVGGGTFRTVEGTWNATNEQLTTALATRHPALLLAELRYRVKSWRAFASCIDDARAALTALREAGITRLLLVGFSMGGGVAVSVAGDTAVRAVLGLAPWLHPQLELQPLAGKRLDVIHGAWDRSIPGVPGVHPGLSRAAFDRARALGVAGTYITIPRGLHGTAVRRGSGSGSGSLLPLPGWRSWVEQVDVVFRRFATGEER